MRVIAGSARGLPLKAPKGLDTRPTSDRTKETLFNVLMPYLSCCKFLDLFSGSGAIGIEAASRGADFVVFVEKTRDAVKCIEENLQFTKLTEGSKVIKADYLSALIQLNDKEVFDVIFMDPPYNKKLEMEALKFIAESHLIHEESIIVVEASNETDFSYLEDFNLQIEKVKKYKTNSHVFIKRRTNYESSDLSGKF